LPRFTSTYSPTEHPPTIRHVPHVEAVTAWFFSCTARQNSGLWALVELNYISHRLSLEYLYRLSSVFHPSKSMLVIP